MKCNGLRQQGATGSPRTPMLADRAGAFGSGKADIAPERSVILIMVCLSVIAQVACFESQRDLRTAVSIDKKTDWRLNNQDLLMTGPGIRKAVESGWVSKSRR